MNTMKAIDPNVSKTHAALFDTWFPIEQRPIPPAIVNDIANIAVEVSAGMLTAFSQSAFFSILQGITYPQSLPLYAGLAQSKNPAVQAFIKVPGGYGELAEDDRSPTPIFLLV